MDNIISSNESYKDKLENIRELLLWNETLRKDTYKANIGSARFLKHKHNLDLRAVPDKYGPEELEYRHRLLFHIANIIWDGVKAEELPSTNEDDIKRYIQQRRGG